MRLERKLYFESDHAEPWPPDFMQSLQPRARLPRFGGYAVERDFANILIDRLFAARPRYVMELGSGVSTLLIAYALENIGRGRFVSIDHNHLFRALTLRHIRRHGLQRWASVAHCPLTRVILGNGQWKWYDIPKSLLAEPIDFLIVDGPPARLQKLSRYPALPLLRSYLAPNATILMNDISKPDGHEILAIWQKTYPFRDAQVLPTKKGCAILAF